MLPNLNSCRVHDCVRRNICDLHHVDTHENAGGIITHLWTSPDQLSSGLVEYTNMEHLIACDPTVRDLSVRDGLQSSLMGFGVGAGVQGDNTLVLGQLRTLRLLSCSVTERYLWVLVRMTLQALEILIVV